MSCQPIEIDRHYQKSLLMGLKKYRTQTAVPDPPPIVHTDGRGRPRSSAAIGGCGRDTQRIFAPRFDSFIVRGRGRAP